MTGAQRCQTPQPEPVRQGPRLSGVDFHEGEGCIHVAFALTTDRHAHVDTQVFCCWVEDVEHAIHFVDDHSVRGADTASVREEPESSADVTWVAQRGWAHCCGVHRGHKADTALAAAAVYDEQQE